jgi:hypothetical protein
LAAQPIVHSRPIGDFRPWGQASLSHNPADFLAQANRSAKRRCNQKPKNPKACYCHTDEKDFGAAQ